VTNQNGAADCPAEVLPEVPAPAAARLRQLLDGLSHAGIGVVDFRSLLTEWLAVASDAGRLVPPGLIAPLLDTRDIVMASTDFSVVVGERGRWMARGNPRWARRLGLPLPVDPAVVLRHGPEEDRVQALRAIRAVDPGRGREVLAAVWSDIGWSGYPCLLALRVGLSPEDEPFLESVRASDTRGSRHAAEEVLSLLPGSTFAEQVRARARATVRISRSQDGVAVAVSGNPSQIELRDIVSWTWPADWPAEVLRAVAHTEWADDIFAGIVRGLLRLHRGDDLPPGYRALTRTLIELADLTSAKFPASLDHAQDLLSRLPRDEAEALVIEQLRGRPMFGLHLGRRVGGRWTPWGPRHSAAHLRALAGLPRAEALSKQGTWLGLRTFAFNADLATFDNAHTVLTGLAIREPAIAGEVDRALDTLRLRRLMREEIATPDR